MTTPNYIASRMLEIAKVRKALEELYLTTLNEMVSRGLPLEWQDNCPMERARQTLRREKPGVPTLAEAIRKARGSDQPPTQKIGYAQSFHPIRND